MARPPLDVGTYGKISTRLQPNGRWRAEARFRDHDGVTRLVGKVGDSEAKAIRSLKQEFAGRQHGAGLTSNARFREAGELWLAEVKRTRVGSTWDRYRGRLHNGVLPDLGELRLSEITPSRVDSYLRELERTLAPNTVRGYRNIVSGVLGYAVRMDALSKNPADGAGRVRGGNVRDTKRALTPDERQRLLLALDTDRRAGDADVPDVIRYLMGTGVRLSEALGLRWFRVDLQEGVSVHGDGLVRETGRGPVLHEPKSLSGFRILPLPDFVTQMLHMRYPGEGHDEYPVFGYETGQWRCPNNYHHAIRNACDRAGFGWVTSHVMRHTAATILDQHHLSPREISGYIGHANPAFTQRVYMDQRPETRRASDALDSALRVRRTIEHYRQ